MCHWFPVLLFALIAVALSGCNTNISRQVLVTVLDHDGEVVQTMDGIANGHVTEPTGEIRLIIPAKPCKSYHATRSLVLIPWWYSEPDPECSVRQMLKRANAAKAHFFAVTCVMGPKQDSGCGDECDLSDEPSRGSASDQPSLSRMLASSAKKGNSTASGKSDDEGALATSEGAPATSEGKSDDEGTPVTSESAPATSEGKSDDEGATAASKDGRLSEDCETQVMDLFKSSDARIVMIKEPQKWSSWFMSKMDSPGKVPPDLRVTYSSDSMVRVWLLDWFCFLGAAQVSLIVFLGSMVHDPATEWDFKHVSKSLPAMVLIFLIAFIIAACTKNVRPVFPVIYIFFAIISCASLFGLLGRTILANVETKPIVWKCAGTFVGLALTIPWAIWKQTLIHNLVMSAILLQALQLFQASSLCTSALVLFLAFAGEFMWNITRSVISIDHWLHLSSGSGVMPFSFINGDNFVNFRAALLPGILLAYLRRFVAQVDSPLALFFLPAIGYLVGLWLAMGSGKIWPETGSHELEFIVPIMGIFTGVGFLCQGCTDWRSSFWHGIDLHTKEGNHTVIRDVPNLSIELELARRTDAASNPLSFKV